MLDLTGCEFYSSFSLNVIRRLSQLEELYLPVLEHCIAVQPTETNDIFLVIKSLTRLRRLKLWVSPLHFPPDFDFPELEDYHIFIIRAWTVFHRIFNAARSLHINQEVFPYNAVSQLLGNLESLVVSGIKDEYLECLTNKTQQKVSVSMILRNLKQVTIKHCSNLKVVFQMEEVEENGAPLLSNLKILRLQSLPDLSCIWELPTQHVRLESLVELTIRECPALKSLFSLSLAQSLVLLEKLDIMYCDELKQIVAELEGDEGEISSTINSHNSLCFPKLAALDISFCRRLEYIFPTQHVSLESLVYLTILHCPRLKSLFSLSLVQSLVLLEELDIRYCDELKQIVTELEGDEGEISSAINSHTSLCFPKLTKLNILSCPRLKYIFPTSLASNGLQGLTLDIRGCPKLKQVFRVANDSMLQYQHS
ncbi:hypothetical protein Goshw_027245, partial [Gossypium schwendimanii]|nr:hypothetical protein [Gossypium schwendimanii]